MPVTLIADGGPHVGLGHLSRSSALAAALVEIGVEIRCLANGAEAPLERYGIAWEPSSGGPISAGAVVLDSYLFDATELPFDPAALAIFHDEPAQPPPAALVIRPVPASIGGEPDEIIAGPEFACLGPDFWELPDRVIAAGVEQVLITMGATGTLDPQLLAAAVGGVPGAVVTFVRGPAATEPAPAGAEVLQSPPSLREGLLAADLVITGAGQSVLESAATGAPTIAVLLAENQRPGAEELERRGAIRLAAAGENARIGSWVAELGGPEGADARAGLSERARSVIDGRGAHRVAGRVADLPGAR